MERAAPPVRVAVAGRRPTAASLVEPTEKPPYRIPSMAEVAALRGTSGLRVVSTFSGCGGSCLGFEMAGYETLIASEFVPAAADTYLLNHPGVPVVVQDVRDIEAETILRRIGCDQGEVDVVEGSPPCASFSTSGRGARHWGEEKPYSDRRQRTDDLFYEFARLVRGIQPRAFVAENVSGLVRGAAKGYFKRIHAALEEAGYRVEARMLDAQWLGVPQVRRRVIFVGVRRDLGRDPAFPDPLPYRYSIRDALGEATSVGLLLKAGYEVEVGASAAYGTEGWKGIDEPAGTIGASVQTGNGRSPSGMLRVTRGDTIPDDVGLSLEGYAIAEEWDRLRPGESSERYFDLVRPDQDAPSPTITAATGQAGAPAGVASVTHPTEKRKFSIAELRRLCGFPDDFALTGSYSQQWERLGRAVPPPMMRAVAETIRDRVLS